MGIPFDASKTSPRIADLARRSLAGDKRAQLNLGIAFEDGLGVGRDVNKARKLFKMAASDSGGPIWVYIPKTSYSNSQILRIENQPKIEGLEDAKKRLELIGKHQ